MQRSGRLPRDPASGSRPTRPNLLHPSCANVGQQPRRRAWRPPSTAGEGDVSTRAPGCNSTVASFVGRLEFGGTCRPFVWSKRLQGSPARRTETCSLVSNPPLRACGEAAKLARSRLRAVRRRLATSTRLQRENAWQQSRPPVAPQASRLLVTAGDSARRSGSVRTTFEQRVRVLPFAPRQARGRRGRRSDDLPPRRARASPRRRAGNGDCVALRDRPQRLPVPLGVGRPPRPPRIAVRSPRAGSGRRRRGRPPRRADRCRGRSAASCPTGNARPSSFATGAASGTRRLPPSSASATRPSRL